MRFWRTSTLTVFALAPRWPGTLPAGVVDYAAEVRSHGDVFLPWMDPTGQEMLLVSEDQAYDDAGLGAFAGTNFHHAFGVINGSGIVAFTSEPASLLMY